MHGKTYFAARTTSQSPLELVITQNVARLNESQGKMGFLIIKKPLFRARIKVKAKKHKGKTISLPS
jgi:hypothetical protein